MARRRIAAAATAAVALIMSTLNLAPVALAQDKDGPDAPAEQWRSYWVDSFQAGIYTPAQVRELVDDALAINANVLIVQVSRWMDCFCNRSTFPRTHADIDPAPYDPLDEVIAQAHAAGLEVHAWVNATPMWNASYAPPDPDHIFHRHGPDARGADRWLNVQHDGTETVGANLHNIDPAHPDAVDYVVEGINSIVREYDVDGINLDYIRYPDGNSTDEYSEWGYGETSLARFQAATGRTDIPDPADAEFSAWRREQVTNYVRKIYLTMLDTDPSARLSVNGITYWYGPQSYERGWEQTRTYSEVLQDWRGWLEEGIIDVNVAMNYKVETDEGDRIRMYEEWNEVLKDWQGQRYSVIGPALYLNTIEDSVSQARRALEPSAAGNTAAGWSGYSYATPSSTANEQGTPQARRAERAALVEALTSADPTGAEPLFAEQAAVPAMPWRDEPSAGHLAGAVTLRGGAALDAVRVEATNLRTGERVTGRMSDGAGWFGYTNVEPGRYLVRIELPGGVVGPPVQVVTVHAGAVAQAEFKLTKLKGD